MKWLSVLCLFGLVACAHDRTPASLNGHPVAQDSMALGNVKATAIKVADKQDVCFDINLTMKGVTQPNAQASNWTVAWVDKKEQYHLLPMNQRDPASVPQGGQVIAPYGAYQEWTNTFRTCAQGANINDVKTLVLTPKELPYKKDDGLRLSWQ